MLNSGTQPDKDAQIAALQARIAQLEAALRTAQIDPQFAILTRRGIDQRWHDRPAQADTVIFFDIDCVHEHNAQWGYGGTDRRIAAVLAQVGNSWVFRWFSGDEFGLLCLASDAWGFATRVQGLLHAQGMSATFGIARLVDNDLPLSVDRAAALVEAAKAQNRRGTINGTPPPASAGGPAQARRDLEASLTRWEGEGGRL